jgi:hypothetical protein
MDTLGTGIWQKKKKKNDEKSGKCKTNTAAPGI